MDEDALGNGGDQGKLDNLRIISGGHLSSLVFKAADQVLLYYVSRRVSDVDS